MLIDLASYKKGKWMPGRNEAADDYYETIDDELDISDGYFLIPVEEERFGVKQMVTGAVPIRYFIGPDNFVRQLRHVDELRKKLIYDDINQCLSTYAEAHNRYQEELLFRSYATQHAAYRHRKSC